MSNVNNRIRELVDHFSKGNKSDFAKKLGVSEANIRNYLNNTEPKFNILEGIVKKFDVSSEWLLTGDGNMIKGETLQVAEFEKEMGDLYVNTNVVKVIHNEIIEILREVVNSKEEIIDLLKNKVDILQKEVDELRRSFL